MPRACHEPFWPGDANLPAREPETKAVGRAPTLSNVANASKTPASGLDLLAAVAFKASIPTENSIG
jgi:hypothetical protein